MTPRCTWCCEPIAEVEFPPPAGFCSVDHHAYYRFACAELGQDMHKAGAISIETLQRDFNERWNRYNPAFLILPRARPRIVQLLEFLFACGWLWLCVVAVRFLGRHI